MFDIPCELGHTVLIDVNVKPNLSKQTDRRLRCFVLIFGLCLRGKGWKHRSTYREIRMTAACHLCGASYMLRVSAINKVLFRPKQDEERVNCFLPLLNIHAYTKRHVKRQRK